MSEHLFQVGAEADGARLDLFVGERLSLSRARVKTLFEAGDVWVNDRRASKGSRITPGQSIRVKLADEGATLVPELEAPLSILFEDAALVLVDKPAGQPCHPLKPGETGTVANALVGHFPECAEASTDPREGGLCHRLDIETSGVLAAARSRAAWEEVRKQFSDRTVEKRYWALVTGPIADDGEIDLPLKHHPRGDRVEPALSTAGVAREALSHFHVLDRSGEYSLVEVGIATGVLHQVRAHLAAIGAPVVGDALYGGRPEPGLRRFFLHARLLGLRHPLDGSAVKKESPLPPELTAVLDVRGLRRVV